MGSHRKIAAVIIAGALVAAMTSVAGGQTERKAAHLRWSRLPTPNSALPNGTARAVAKWPAVRNNFEVLGHERMKVHGANGDVWFFDHGEEGKFAYVGNWVLPCPGSVKIVDVTDPANPEWVAEAAGRKGVDFQDVVVRTIGGRDILAVGLQECSGKGKGGLALYDVTNPRKPKFLSFLKTPGFGVHEVDVAVQEDGSAYALMAVPYIEQILAYGGPDRGGEFRIADISDPNNPVEVSDWGIIADSDVPRTNSVEPVTFPAQGLGSFPFYFDHSARAADNGTTAYVSYWDGGVLKFDINDPANPSLVGRTTFPVDSDGNAHSLTLYDTEGTRYILQNQEDYDPLTPAAVTTSITGSTEYAAFEEYWMRTILSETGPITAEVHDAGDGCEAGDFSGAAGKIALVDWNDPFLGDQPACGKKKVVANAADADPAALMINVVSPERPFVHRLDVRAPNLVVVEISSLDPLASAIREAAAPVTATLTPNTPSWGALRIYSEAAATDVDGDGVLEYEQVAEFSDLPHVTGSLEEVDGPGAYTIHNTEVNGNRSYSSWYSNGVVALDLTNPADPQLVGQFVPRSNNELKQFFGKGPSLVWGVAVDPATGIIYASDMKSGLWIVQPTGPAVPTAP